MTDQHPADQHIAGALTGALDDLERSGAVRRPELVQHVLTRLAREAFTAGRAAALFELRTAPEVAADLGVTVRRVQALAHSRRLGSQVGREWLFTAAEVDAMRDRRPGRPAKRHP